MARRWFWICCSTAVLISCKGGVLNQGNHLPPEVMKKLMMDVHIVEAYSTYQKDSVYRPGLKNLDSLAVYYRNVFDHYKITPAEFAENLDWYRNHPEELDSVYDKMVSTSNSMLTSITAAAQKGSKDSVASEAKK